MPCDKKASVGGQAVIEGVMMRAPGKLVVAVRKPDGGIAVKRDDIKIDSNPFFQKPVVRGLVSLYDAMVLGIKALNFSADHAMPEEKDKEGGKTSKLWTYFSMFIGIALGVLLFVYLPLFLTDLAAKAVPLLRGSSVAFNITDGIIRVIFFLLYIFIISKSKDIARVFAYHGAEHKAIFAYEKGLDLTVENARGMGRLHPRCGTSFLLIVMIVAILVFSIIPKDAVFMIKFGSRVLLLPVIAGLSYEILKLSGRHADNIVVKALIAPGLALQRLTTREPDDAMLEVALLSIKEALRKDGDEEKDAVPEYVEYVA